MSDEQARAFQQALQEQLEIAPPPLSADRPVRTTEGEGGEWRVAWPRPGESHQGAEEGR